MLNIREEKNKGFSLIEILVTAAIFVLLIIVVTGFQSKVFKLNNVLQLSLNIQQNARKILRPFAEEIRSATISNIGAYPISIASSTEISFYSDIDDDNLKEKIRYFKSGDEFKKGVIKPSGDPLSYNPDDENIVSVVKGVINDSQPVFEYYDSNYNGTSSSTPLSYPINISDITLVKATLLVDENPNQPPGPMEISTQAMFRNLKKN